MNIFELNTNLNTHEKAINYLETIRWNNKPTCVYCSSNKVCKHHTGTTKRWQCWSCHKSFSVTVGTIFHHTYIPLHKWFMLIALMLNAKKGLSACQAARDLGMRRPTVWSMMHRIRKAMNTPQAELLQGIIEMDECYIGGKPRKENKKDDNNDKPSQPRGRGTKKTPVVGMVEREGSVKTQVTSKDELKFKDFLKMVKKNINIAETLLVTDEYKAYNNMGKTIAHYNINHSYEYARGDIHTNTIESFWAILKRGITGQFHWVSKKYLQNYLYEFEFKYNNRANKTNITFEDLMGRMCYGR